MMARLTCASTYKLYLQFLSLFIINPDDRILATSGEECAIVIKVYPIEFFFDFDMVQQLATGRVPVLQIPICIHRQ